MLPIGKYVHSLDDVLNFDMVITRSLATPNLISSINLL